MHEIEVWWTWGHEKHVCTAGMLIEAFWTSWIDDNVDLVGSNRQNRKISLKMARVRAGARHGARSLLPFDAHRHSAHFMYLHHVRRTHSFCAQKKCFKNHSRTGVLLSNSQSFCWNKIFCSVIQNKRIVLSTYPTVLENICAETVQKW